MQENDQTGGVHHNKSLPRLRNAGEIESMTGRTVASDRPSVNLWKKRREDHGWTTIKNINKKRRVMILNKIPENLGVQLGGFY